MVSLNQAFYRAIAVPEVVLLALDENQVVYGDIFPRIPLIPRFAVARVLPRGMWGMRGMFLAGSNG